MKLTIIGLGYVGLPLAIELSKNYSTFAYDIDRNRIEALKLGKDINNQFRKKDFIDLKNLNFTSKKEDLTNSDIFFKSYVTCFFFINLIILEILSKSDWVSTDNFRFLKSL